TEDVKAGKEAEEQFRILSSVIDSDLRRAVVAIAPELDTLAKYLISAEEAAGRLFAISRENALKGDIANLEESIGEIQKDLANPNTWFPFGGGRSGSEAK